MAKDPVCGMDVDEKKAKYKTEYLSDEGETYFKTYYFCSEHCKEEFEKDPKKYIE
ncbi:MAG: YHS domain-containing protein [archaeon]|nr:YHS domain-containing protein [archaeon]MCP8306356.1 YHS domain-containing protein [archaeon]